MNDLKRPHLFGFCSFQSIKLFPIFGSKSDSALLYMEALENFDRTVSYMHMRALERMSFVR